MKKFLLMAAVLLALGGLGQKSIPDFKLTNVQNGASVSLSDFSGMPGVVLVFTSNTCPFDAYYRARIRSLMEEYAGKIQFVLINSYLETDENEEAMKTAYSSWQLAAPYLADKDQNALQAVDARRSPEVFLLKSTKAGMTVYYQGAIDDSPQLASAVRQRFLQAAIDQLLKGGAPPAANRSAGCTIRRK
jgi:peroxiredoxin